MLNSLLLLAPLEVVLDRVLACASRCGLEPESFDAYQLRLQDSTADLLLNLWFEPSGTQGDRWLVLGTPIPPESLAGLERLDQLLRCLQTETPAAD